MGCLLKHLKIRWINNRTVLHNSRKITTGELYNYPNKCCCFNNHTNVKFWFPMGHEHQSPGFVGTICWSLSSHRLLARFLDASYSLLILFITFNNCDSNTYTYVSCFKRHYLCNITWLELPLADFSTFIALPAVIVKLGKQRGACWKPSPVNLYCTSLPVRSRQADERLDGTLTFQQKCIALTFDVHIDPMYWVAISPETNIYNWYWVPMVLFQCLEDALQQYKSIHTYRHNMDALVLTGHLRMAERLEFNRPWSGTTNLSPSVLNF